MARRKKLGAKAPFGQFAGRNMRFKKFRQGARPSRAEPQTLNTPNSYLLVGLRLISYSAVDIRFPTRPRPASCLNQFWHFTTRGPNKGNASQEIDCENKQPDRPVCSRVFCASSLAAFGVSLSAPIPNCFGVGTKCNKNVTGNIDCLSLTWKRKNSLDEETER